VIAETNEVWNRLERWQNNIEVDITLDKYLSMCEQLGEEPNPDKMPPEVSDFPVDVQKAMMLFNKLGDRIYPDIGYLGKDYTQLPIYIKVYEIENTELFLETLLRLDSKVIEK